MTWHLHIREEAEFDIVDAVAWYEEQRIGLGTKLLVELDSVVERIVRNPYQFRAVKSDIRRAFLHRFPYSVYFHVTNQMVDLIAVLHQHRDPRVLDGRIANDAE